jgi:uncharacterized lipoprotein NlpE involved in copper resistance
MKKIIFALLIVLFGLSLVGCSTNSRIDKPDDTNLEFWVGENVDNFDFSNHNIRYGRFGGTDYYGLGYTPQIDENDVQVDPEYYVVYTVTSYPDYSSKQKCVTIIEIADPAVTFYGLGLTSTIDEFDDVLTIKEFEITEKGNNYRRYVNGKYTIAKTDKLIYIMIKVSNKNGIIF